MVTKLRPGHRRSGIRPSCLVLFQSSLKASQSLACLKGSGSHKFRGLQQLLVLVGKNSFPRMLGEAARIFENLVGCSKEELVRTLSKPERIYGLGRPSPFSLIQMRV